MVEGERSVPIAFSSEEPYARPWGIEILDHSKKAMRNTRINGNGLPLLLEHQRGNLIGRVRDIVIGEDRVARGVATFAAKPAAEEALKDVRDGVLTDASVGYQIHFMEEIKAEKLSPELMKLSAELRSPVYLITDWEPYEVSLVAVAADPTVGVGRTAGDGNDPNPLRAPVTPASTTRHTREDKKMEPDVTITNDQQTAVNTDELCRQAGADATAKERERVRSINDVYRHIKHFIPESVRDRAVDEGMSLADFQTLAFKSMGDPRPLPHADTELGLSQKEIRRYSVTRAILSQVPDSRVDAGLELECHRELLKKYETRKGGILIPGDALRQPADPQGTRGQRDLSIVGGNAAGGYLVGTDHLGSSFIELLRNTMLLRRLGATVLSGLRGNVAIPKRSAGATSYWVSETAEPTEGANTFAQVALSPKTVGAFIDYTRELLLQSNPSIDTLINGDLAQSVATAIDLAGFHGSGTSGQPQGIVGATGVGSVDATGGIDYAKMLEFQTDVATANALANRCAYVTTPAVAAIMAAKPKFSNGTVALWDGNILESDNVCGYRGFSTNQISASHVVFGDFSQVLIGEWGVLELLVNPYLFSASRIIRVTAFQSVDIALRYGGAFSVATNVTS